MDIAMTVIETTLATDFHVREERFRWSQIPIGILALLVKALLPAANPDFKRSYENVRKWWVEIDAAGVPQREIGFDSSGEVIVAGPIGENMGFWTDSHMVLVPSEDNVRSSEKFEAAWLAFVASHPAIADKD